MIINDYIKKFLPLQDLDNLFVVADFDRTITDGNSHTSWSVLSLSNLLPESYILERKSLFDYYRPIEISENIDFSLKSQKMKEWFQKHIELFVKYKISEEIFDQASMNIEIMKLRPYAKEFIKYLYDNHIPLLIISAGIGNFIKSFLINNSCYFDNIYICSNNVIFQNGIAVGIEKNIIHSLNKNEISIPIYIKEKIKNKNNVILLGDQVSDLNMVNKDNYKLVINVGFLTPDYSLNTMVSNFDIVCEDNDNYDKIQRLLFNN